MKSFSVEMADCVAEQEVQVELSDQFVWINVDGICIARIRHKGPFKTKAAGIHQVDVPVSIEGLGLHLTPKEPTNG